VALAPMNVVVTWTIGGTTLDTAAVQARRGRRSLDDEVLRLLIHGTLHLLGHDHERSDDARKMRAEERRVWRALHE